MLVEDVQLLKKVIEFKRTEDLYDIVVVSKDLSDDLMGLDLSGKWFEVPRAVAQPLGALIDAFSDVEYDLATNSYSKTLKYSVYKIVNDEDLPIERGVEDGLYSVFLNKDKRFSLYGYADSHYYFNEIVEDVSRKIKSGFHTLSLCLIEGQYVSNLSDEKRIRYTEIVNKYWRNDSFAFNSYRDGGKLAKYKSDLGNTYYIDIEFNEYSQTARLILYIEPTDPSL